MNFEKILCKMFDTDKKGYVTIGDIIFEILYVTPFILCILLSVILLGQAFASSQNIEPTDGSFHEFIYMILKAWVFPGIGIIAVYILLYICVKISNIKVLR